MTALKQPRAAVEDAYTHAGMDVRLVLLIRSAPGR